eukprot:CAMPEP_0184678138 /NCGR_PEP_ID=MMETSP0312-20130426/835_1 /TAXON_ID=31354 /ORGANISM="Compsopogon coeruleus, Strain SAG 36.94" /LENGTH=323 /DNA_ID=CAMNT_0027126625 /DNA_START=324 /DNA_END=1295 /DNA_ORIENTATION=-
MMGGVTWETEIGKRGDFERKPTTFRSWVRRDSSAVEGQHFPPESGRYHLFVSLACPWAHRVLILRSLKGLHEAIGVTVVHHFLGPQGWAFVKEGDADVPVECKPDPILGARYLSEIYYSVNAAYDGRYTVPVLYDRMTGTIVNNESKELIVMLNSEFDEFATNSELDLYPEEQRDEIDKVAEGFYNSVNNGVYRCGFATTQEAYDRAVEELFPKLDELEARLSMSPFLLGPNMTLADIRLFTTLYRFDAVYYTHFKCNIRRIAEYPALYRFLVRMYNYPGIQETCNMEHCKLHYFRSHTSINPKSIVPRGPDLSTYFNSQQDN